MDASAQLLVRLAHVCAWASDPDELLADAVTLLRGLAGAQAVGVLRGPDAAQLLLVRDGADLDAEPRVTRTLPGVLGTLVVAAPADERALTAGLDVLLTALARLEAETRFADLTVRVNSAQQLANMGDYDWHIASDTNRWSDQLYRIYGHEPQSFNASYERFLGHIHPEDRERIQGIHQRAYATGEPYQMIERIVRPNGEVRYLSSNGQVIQDDTGTPIRMRGTCIDITDRVLAEQAREQTAARFRELVEYAPDAILVHERDGRIVQANRHASELLRADPVGHSVDEILPIGSSGLALAADGLDGRPLRLDVTTAELGGDDEPLTAVFLRDATPRLRGESLAAALRETQVRRRQALEINDNVVQGLSAAMYSLAGGDVEASTSYLQATLTAARKLMNDWLDPIGGQKVGPGDLVRERASTLEPESPTDRGDAAPAAHEQPRVLIVDDFRDVRALLRMQLEAVGSYQVVGEAGDGVEAVELAAQLQPDVVLLDLAMPKMDGLQALPLIRDAVHGVRVIVLSGFDQGSMAQKALDAGADRYVEKGLRMNLAQVISGVLSAA